MNSKEDFQDVLSLISILGSLDINQKSFQKHFWWSNTLTCVIWVFRLDKIVVNRQVIKEHQNFFLQTIRLLNFRFTVSTKNVAEDIQATILLQKYAFAFKVSATYKRLQTTENCFFVCNCLFSFELNNQVHSSTFSGKLLNFGIILSDRHKYRAGQFSDGFVWMGKNQWH